LTITCNIQKVDFFVDQIEDKGLVDLIGAIDAFQNFPFEDQLQQAAQRELTSCFPTISFKSSDDHDNNFELGWGIQLLISLFWFPGTLLHLTYWFKNNNATVKVDQKAKIIKYIKDDKEISFNRQEIVNCEINESRNWSAPWSGYRYLLIVLKDHRKVVISNFITEPEKIIDLLKLNFKIDKRTIPFLPI
jgi:hypothetical protein